MSKRTVTDHVRLSYLDGEGTKNVLYPESTSKDVLIDKTINPNFTDFTDDLRLTEILENVKAMAFIDKIIDDSQLEEYIVCTEYTENALLVVDDSTSDDSYDSSREIWKSIVEEYIPNITSGQYVKKAQYSTFTTWSSAYIDDRLNQLRDRYVVLNTTVTSNFEDLEKQITKINGKVTSDVIQINNILIEISDDIGVVSNNMNEYIQTGLGTVSDLSNNKLPNYRQVISNNRRYMYYPTDPSSLLYGEHYQIVSSYEKCSSTDEGAMIVIDSQQGIPEDNRMPLWFVKGDITDIAVGDYVREKELTEEFDSTTMVLYKNVRMDIYNGIIYTGKYVSYFNYDSEQYVHLSDLLLSDEYKDFSLEFGEETPDYYITGSSIIKIGHINSSYKVTVDSDEGVTAGLETDPVVRINESDITVLPEKELTFDTGNTSFSFINESNGSLSIVSRK